MYVCSYMVDAVDATCNFPSFEILDVVYNNCVTSGSKPVQRGWGSAGCCAVPNLFSSVRTVTPSSCSSLAIHRHGRDQPAGQSMTGYTSEAPGSVGT